MGLGNYDLARSTSGGRPSPPCRRNTACIARSTANSNGRGRSMSRTAPGSDRGDAGRTGLDAGAEHIQMKNHQLVLVGVWCFVCSHLWGAEQLGSLSTGARVLAVESQAKQWGIRVESSGKASVEITQPLRLQWYEAEDKITEVAAAIARSENRERPYRRRGARHGQGRGCTHHRPLDHLRADLAAVEEAGRVRLRSRRLLFQAGRIHRRGTALPRCGHVAPGMIYGGPNNLLDRAPGGLANFASGRFEMREDGFPMPVLGLHFRDGTSLALLDSSPRARPPSPRPTTAPRL